MSKFARKVARQKRARDLQRRDWIVGYRLEMRAWVKLVVFVVSLVVASAVFAAAWDKILR